MTGYSGPPPLPGISGKATSPSDPTPSLLEAATHLLGHLLELAGVIAFDDADLSPMARSFYEGSRRIGNARIKSELGVKLRYPTYREGLRALLEKHSAP